jgi:YVTN family beta-propeller protein
MFKKFFIVLLSLFIVACQAQEPNTVLSTPNLEGVFFEPSGIAVTPNGLYAYVVNVNTVSVIEIATNTVVDTIGTAEASAIAITPNGQYAYLGSAPVQVIELANNTIFGTVPDTDASSGIGTIAITPNGQYAYIINQYSGNQVSVIDLRPTSGTYNMVIANIPIGNTDGTIAITPDGNYAYATSPSNNAVYVISTATNAIIDTIGAITQPSYIAITPNNQYAYISSSGFNGIISVVNIVPSSPDYLTVVDTISFLLLFLKTIAITPNGAYAYVSVQGPTLPPSGNVFVIDLATNTVLSTPGLVGAFEAPLGMAITPNNAFVYVGDDRTESVVVIYTGISGSAPVNFTGCKRKDIFLTQIDNYNYLTWSAPTIGTPVSYQIYRDAALTQLIATVSASGILQYNDHNRNPHVNYTYYIVAVDSLGNTSLPAFTTVTEYC